MDPISATEAAEAITDAVLADITERSGFDAVWESIDEGTKHEIVMRLRDLIFEELVSDDAGEE